MTAVRLLVSDLGIALRTYRDLLRFEVIEQWGPAFAIVHRDCTTLWLSGPGTSAARELEDGSRPAPGGWNRVVIGVQDLAEEVERLTQGGLNVRALPFSGPGGTQALLEDGAGNLIELFEERNS